MASRGGGGTTKAAGGGGDEGDEPRQLPAAFASLLGGKALGPENAENGIRATGAQGGDRNFLGGPLT